MVMSLIDNVELYMPANSEIINIMLDEWRVTSQAASLRKQQWQSYRIGCSFIWMRENNVTRGYHCRSPHYIIST